MGDIKKNKCLVEIYDGVTIVDEQIRLLQECGINDICITTGSYAGKLENYLREQHSANFTFVYNPLYRETNYIYSIYLALDHLSGDFIMMHGDLLFEKSLLAEVINYSESSMVIDYKKPLPEKDFKAVIAEGKITAVGVNYFENAVYAQPLYKLFLKDWLLWSAEITRFCQEGNRSVYAENALNIKLSPIDAAGRYCFEVDDENDLKFAREMFQKDIVKLK